MKKLLGLLGITNLSILFTSNIIACDMSFDETTPQNDLIKQIEADPSLIVIERQGKTAVKPKTKVTPTTQSIEPTTPTVTPTTQSIEPPTLPKKETTFKSTLTSTSTKPLESVTTATPVTRKVDPPQIQTRQAITTLISPKSRLQISPTYFFQDKNNNNYFVTNEGLYVGNQQSDTLIKIDNTYNANIWHTVIDSKNNIYFASYSAGFGSDNYGQLFVIKNNTTSAVEIDGIKIRIHNITIDNYDNVYLDTDNGLHVLKHDQTKVVLWTLIQPGEFIDVKALKKAKVLWEDQSGKLWDENHNEIKRIYYWKTLGFDNNNNLYFTTLNETHVLKYNETKPIKINNLDGEIKSIAFNQDNIYFATKSGPYVLKQNETTANKIATLDFSSANKTNYFFIHHNKIFIGSLHATHILDFNHNLIKSLPFGSDSLNYDNQNNIYFATGRGLYKFNITNIITNRYEKIKIKRNGRLIDSDDEIKSIDFIKNQIYFSEYTRQGNNFYKITTNNIAEPINESEIYS